ncbi:hypothetical protein A2U01_0077220, partial [Trifolium medium]|nr:hypothetical protein [Trifolium medium]
MIALGFQNRTKEEEEKVVNLAYPQDFNPKGNDWKSRMIALGLQNNRTKKEEVVNLADPQDFSSKGNW